MAEKGDCYRLAYLHARGLDDEGEEGVTICHGWVTNPNGTFGHAWVELGDGRWVVETTRDDHVFEGDHYYATLKVKGVVRYTPDDARIEFLRSQHYGPWHESFDSVR